MKKESSGQQVASREKNRDPGGVRPRTGPTRHASPAFTVEKKCIHGLIARATTEPPGASIRFVCVDTLRARRRPSEELDRKERKLNAPII